MKCGCFGSHQRLYYQKIISNVEIKARKGKVIAVATAGDEVIPGMADNVMFVPDADEAIAPMLSVIPLQLLSYYTGLAKGLMLTNRATWLKV